MAMREESGVSRTAFEDAVDGLWRQARHLQADQFVAEAEELLASAPSALTAAAYYEMAGVYDFLGRESEAAPLYRAALQAGLDEMRRPRALLQLASTLRNLGDAAQGAAILETAGPQMPVELAPACAAFQALCLLDAGESARAVATAVRALAVAGGEYRAVLEQYVHDLPLPCRADPHAKTPSES
jgi:tetratricopeptide (TPR) repeat protein